MRISSIARTRAEEENEYLRELNSKLEELRRRQEQMAHNQRLQLMGTLTGGIAHEFNNLLTPIMGYSGMILAEADPADDVYDSAQEIYSAAEKAKEIIRQIASLSRKQPGTAVKPLEIRQAAERVLRIIDTVIPPNVQPDHFKSLYQCVLRHAQPGRPSGPGRRHGERGGGEASVPRPAV